MTTLTPGAARSHTRVILAVLLVAALLALLGPRWAAGLRSLAPSAAEAPPGLVVSSAGSSVGVAGGAVPEGVTVFDDQYPAVAHLDPRLRTALEKATTRAARRGITIVLHSGWRSAAYQQQLLDDAVGTYGSAAQAARWVATPNTSPHVSGDAVDLGGSDATAWLAKRGARFGLCRIYDNEPWHYELRGGASVHGCPEPYADPTHDPRMR